MEPNVKYFFQHVQENSIYRLLILGIYCIIQKIHCRALRGLSMKLVTFNIRYDCSQDRENNFCHRKPLILAKIRQEAPVAPSGAASRVNASPRLSPPLTCLLPDAAWEKTDFDNSSNLVDKRVWSFLREASPMPRIKKAVRRQTLRTAFFMHNPSRKESIELSLVLPSCLRLLLPLQTGAHVMLSLLDFSNDALFGAATLKSSQSTLQRFVLFYANFRH